MASESLPVIQNYVGGQFVPGSGGTLDIIGPRDESVIGRVQLSTAEDVNNACEVSHAAFQKWKRWTVKERMRPMLKLRQLIEENEEPLAELIMKEHGKNYVEALGSIRKGNETVEYACGMPSLIPGKVLEVSNGVKCEEHRMPHGVCASIVPFNFPMMVPLWTLPVAVACGNTYILKPSEKVPMTCNLLMELISQAGFPDGVIQVVQGQAEAVNALIDNEHVKAVAFVGSTRVAELVAKRARNLNKRVLALGGAKNHLIAVQDCNVDMCSTDVLNSYAGCTGQRCMAAANLIVVGENEALIEAICEKSRKVVPGSQKKQLGPLIDRAAVERCSDYVTKAEQSGNAEVLVDGRPWIEEHTPGFWFGPTVLRVNNLDDPCMHDEIFGPVLSIYQVETDEEAIAIENNCPYGNAACIYTTTGLTAETYRKKLSSGMIGVNIGVPVPREPFAFGGTKASKFGDHDITDDGGIEFFTWRQKCTSKWAIPERKTWMS